MKLINPKKALYLAEYSGLYDFDLCDLETLLLDEPAIVVDAVEVVRCKDCKHRDDGVCFLESMYYYPWHYTDDDDFCSRGERRHYGKETQKAD